ncbi:MAG: zinc ribbon domain-containing protein [Planctomycetota bacterium]|nr:zinc ribbon domain-containing protein [Planctomycetota bacterium]
MPTYAYECEACGHHFEKFQSMTANSLRTCPECKARKLQRLIGPGAGIIFKGSGFYETDYRSDSYKKAEKADKETRSKSSEKTSGADTDSKSTGDKTGDKSDNKSSSSPD